ncbi:hypothetical protein FA09DRAFT_93880 [Tilletiopsis washingtonensis]|jgi:hypothetical protein|uniref:Uncharacterized protein n=1 Tax=Tilletiopsis washingtonensis TaxID=58919 RepID=A0A316Z312_9BASI|nr:hypothetical protein FA09DRAFT_93880 [Tilletiopsis washingtonensis]PWN96170.1 hypothetical protein FA09DRAFT_93880 [Tilletiopsis washingtonensis]
MGGCGFSGPRGGSTQGFLTPSRPAGPLTHPRPSHGCCEATMSSIAEVCSTASTLWPQGAAARRCTLMLCCCGGCVPPRHRVDGSLAHPRRAARGARLTARQARPAVSLLRLLRRRVVMPEEAPVCRCGVWKCGSASKDAGYLPECSASAGGRPMLGRAREAAGSVRTGGGVRHRARRDSPEVLRRRRRRRPRPREGASAAGRARWPAAVPCSGCAFAGGARVSERGTADRHRRTAVRRC